jgi:hypothetical protein
MEHPLTADNQRDINPRGEPNAEAVEVAATATGCQAPCASGSHAIDPTEAHDKSNVAGGGGRKKATLTTVCRGFPRSIVGHRAFFESARELVGGRHPGCGSAHVSFARMCAKRPYRPAVLDARRAWRVRSFEPKLPQGRCLLRSRQRVTRIGDTGCPGRTGWGKSTEASGRHGGGRKRDRKARGPWPEKSRLGAPSRELPSDQRWHAAA